MNKKIFSSFLLSFLLLNGMTLTNSWAQVRDPTRPSGFHPKFLKQHEDSKALKFSGVFLSKNRNVALINEEALSKGDKIGEYRVSKIGSRTVTLKKRKDGKSVTMILRLSQADAQDGRKRS